MRLQGARVNKTGGLNTLTIVPVIGATAPSPDDDACAADTNFGDGLFTWNVPSCEQQFIWSTYYNSNLILNPNHYSVNYPPG